MLKREKENKWIFQKNISSSKLITIFLEELRKSNSIDYSSLKSELLLYGGYSGRTSNGSLSTIGVRLSQMCFYMFGYRQNNKFILSPMTQKFFSSSKNLGKNMLVNLFSIQYPHPYSNTPDNFRIYAGRLITRLLTDDRIDSKLYIDEFIWFIPFIETITEDSYQKLVDDIIEYRSFPYSKKKSLFESVPNFDDVFSNVLHEVNYYFLRIFQGFNVFDIEPDFKHNGGNLFKFVHGKSTIRSDAYKSGARISGYVKFKDCLIDDAVKLISMFSCTEKPTSNDDSRIFSKMDWIRTLYEFEPLQYLSVINSDFKIDTKISNILRDMTHDSIYGSKDGKDFEKSLLDTFEIFDDIINTELISGSGETDILCVYRENDDVFKINVDAKTSSKRVAYLNSKRLENHIKKTGAKYCLVVSPKYSKGVKLDIDGTNVSVMEAETLATYISKEYFSSSEETASFKYLNHIILRNLGKAIDSEVMSYIEDVYGI
jgi:hypothetical protein